MKILSAEQIRQADAATIKNEPISSIDLMERASQRFVEQFIGNFSENKRPVYIFSGPGNNGGDGLAIARLLLQKGYKVYPFTVHAQDGGSEDFTINQELLSKQCNLPNIEHPDDIPSIPEESIVIDGLFGSGLSRKIEGIFASVVQAINENAATIVAIDTPSGLYIDYAVEKDAVIVAADYTYTFQSPKLAFLLPQNEQYVGQWDVLDIGLDQNFLAEVETDHYFVTPDTVAQLRKVRRGHSHKGDYGKTILIAGSYGKMGAAVLCASACAKSGVGLLTVHVPECGYEIMQIAVPEAMTTVDADAHKFTSLDQAGRTSLDKYDVVGVGPGIGTDDKTVEGVRHLLQEAKKRSMRMVLDADALNICSQHRELLSMVPTNSILTPHPKEFERLTEKAQDDFHRLELLKAFCQKYQVYVTLKGSNTAIGTPDGKVYFNSTGNPGMATGGTGDVLTGVLTAIISQQYDSLDAALLGVFLHGRAGDLAAAELSQESMVASDLVRYLGKAFLSL